MRAPTVRGATVLEERDWWAVRRHAMQELERRGWSLAEIGALFLVSRQRVHQILRERLA